MDTLVLITQYMFLITMLGMAAGTAYFWLERDSVAVEYRPAVTTAGIYTAIAAFMYWTMQQQIGMDGDLASVLALPTHVRYIDWIITTPLILVTIGLLVQVQERSASILWVVVLADLAMIIFGYFGELFADAEGKSFEAWVMFGMGCMAYVIVLYIVLQMFGDAAKDKVGPVQKAFRNMTTFIILGWLVYPLGFLMGILSDGDTMKVARELTYNIADLINKVGLGLVVVVAAKSITRDARIKKAMRSL
jgi:sensory rhodopsin